MGDPLKEGRCLKCGFELLTADSYFCVQCEKEVQKDVRHRVANRKTPIKKRIKFQVNALKKP